MHVRRSHRRAVSLISENRRQNFTIVQQNSKAKSIPAKRRTISVVRPRYKVAVTKLWRLATALFEHHPSIRIINFVSGTSLLQDVATIKSLPPSLKRECSWFCLTSLSERAGCPVRGERSWTGASGRKGTRDGTASDGAEPSEERTHAEVPFKQTHFEQVAGWVASDRSRVGKSNGTRVQDPERTQVEGQTGLESAILSFRTF